MTVTNKASTGLSRRNFITSTAMGAAALASTKAMAQNADPIRVGLVGCGRRGRGAAVDCINSSPNVSLVAIGDLFANPIPVAMDFFRQLEDKCTVSEDTTFVGWDAYEKVIASDMDLVILATPPGFRPQQLAACVEAGKHTFIEKPVAVDPAGVKSIIATGKKAKRKGLGIVAGTQRRHQAPYVDVVKRIQDGDIGDIVAAQCYWVGDYGYYPAVLPKPGWSEMEAQVRNWNYFTWLSGDHIVEQHVHNIDIINWVMQAHPIRAFGLGGRSQRTGEEFGHIYDHFSVELEYPGGVRVQSLCRQNSDTFSRVEEHIVGTKGVANPGRYIKGENKYIFRGEASNPYQQEHTDLIASIRAGKPLNEAKTIAESTMTAIIGRMACYTGQEVKWKWAMEDSKLDLAPPTYEFGDLAAPPVAVPGVTPLV